MSVDCPQIVVFSHSSRGVPLLGVVRELRGEIHECHTDLEALARVLRGDCDVVLVEQEGLVPERFYRILRRRAEQQALSLVAVLPVDDPARASAAMRAGADAVVTATASLEEVEALIQSQLRLQALRSRSMQDCGVLERALDFVGDGILIMSREGRVLHANRACLQMLDLDPDVLRERSVPQLLNVLGVPRETIDRVMQSEEAFLENIALHTLDGIRTVIVDCRPLPSLPGDPERRWLVQLRDSTLLHALDRMEADFQAWAAHELRSHLSLLTADVEALESAEDRSSQAGVSESMRREVENLAASIEARLAEIQDPHFDCEAALEKVPLLSWLESGMTEVEALAQARGQVLTLKLTPESGSLVFRASAKPLQQVLRYVLVDALTRASEGAQVEIAASVEAEELRVDFRIIEKDSAEIAAPRSGMSTDLLCAQRILQGEGGELRRGVGNPPITHLRLPLMNAAEPLGIS